jgi:hypothetical protein
MPISSRPARGGTSRARHLGVKSIQIAALFLIAALAACTDATDGGPPAITDISEAARDGATCGTIAGLTCAPGSFCIYPDGTCGVADQAGTCNSPAFLCFEIYAPVCGCDHHTYANECVAHRDGVSIAHRGACGRQGEDR